MKFQIFYSWQTSTPELENKALIRLILGKVKEKILQKFPGRFEEVIIFESVGDLPGRNKTRDELINQLRNSQIYIGDFTPESKKFGTFSKFLVNALGLDTGRRGPNRNVVFEHSKAEDSLGPQRMLTVLNTDFGHPNDEPELIPFDQDVFFRPLYFSGKRLLKNEKYINEFAQEVFEKFELIINEIQIENFKKFRPFRKYEDALRYQGDYFEFIQTDKTDQVIQTILQQVQREKALVRILGLSGLGKTRLLFQAFAPGDDDLSKAQNENFLYCNAYIEPTEKISEKIEELALRGENRIIIVDNCDGSNHTELRKAFERRDCKIKLITVFNNPLEEFVSEEGTVKIILSPDDLVPLVDEIVETLFPNLEPDLKSKIKNYSNGFPLLAVALAKQVQGDEGDLRLPSSEQGIVEKLLGPEIAENENLKNAAITLSLFSRIGYKEDLRTTFNSIITNKQISNHVGSDPREIKQCYQKVIAHFDKLGLIEEQGRFISIRPEILGISLAEKWWDGCLEEELPEIFSFLEGNNLTKEFCERWVSLSYHERAIQIVQKLSGEGGPFANAEVLNTRTGSLFFRYIVEVDPITTGRSVVRMLEKQSIEKIKEIDEGRRNLVWALEKVAWHKDAFEYGAKALLHLAAGENEHSISNNATNSFLQLFQILIPPTEADLMQRQEIIEYCLASPFSEIRQIGIAALDKCLQARDFTRMGGSEKQAGKSPMKSYEPNNSEVRDYWNWCLEKLLIIGESEDLFWNYAQQTILSRFREIASAGCFNIVFPRVKKIIENSRLPISEILTKLELTYAFHKDQLIESERNELENSINRIKESDKTLRENYLLIVSRAPHYSPGQKLEEREEAIRTRIQEFAKEFFSSGEPIEDYWDLILAPNQSGPWYFGKYYAEELLENKGSLLPIGKKLLARIEEIREDEFDIRFPLAFFRCIPQRDEAIELANFLVDTEIPEFLIARLLSSFPIDFELYIFLIEKIKSGRISVQYFLEFKYQFQSSTVGDVIDIASQVREMGQKGIPIAFEFLYSNVYNEESRWAEAKAFLIQCIEKGRLLGSRKDLDINSAFSPSLATQKILEEANEPDFAMEIVSQILERNDDEDYFSIGDYATKKILTIIFEKHFAEVAPIFLNAIVFEKLDIRLYLNLKNLLGSRIDFQGSSTGLLFQRDNDLILEWAKENRPKGPNRLAGFLPIFSDNIIPGESKLHPFTSAMIDEFGDSQEFLDELSTQFHSYGWQGSLVPLLKSLRGIIESLRDHKFESVRNWAIKETGRFDKQIQEETYYDLEEPY